MPQLAYYDHTVEMISFLTAFQSMVTKSVH
jgi:hypothetical protein